MPPFGIRDVGAELRRAMREQNLRRTPGGAGQILQERAAEAQKRLDEETLAMQDQYGGLEGPSYPSSATTGPLGFSYSPSQIQGFRMAHLARLARGMTGAGAVEYESDVGPIAAMKQLRQLHGREEQAFDYDPETYALGQLTRGRRR